MGTKSTRGNRDVTHPAATPSFSSLPFAHPPGAYTFPRGRSGSSEDAAHAPVSSIMTRDVVCVRDDLAASALNELFFSRGLHGAPVLNDRSELVGFVSIADLYRRHYEDGGDTVMVESEPGGLGPGFHQEPEAQLVRDLMMPHAISLRDTAPIAMAAALMAFEGVHRVPVVDGDGIVVGILSAIDVLRWLATQDGYAVPPRDHKATRQRAARKTGGDKC